MLLRRRDAVSRCVAERRQVAGRHYLGASSVLQFKQPYFAVFKADYSLLVSNAPSFDSIMLEVNYSLRHTSALRVRPEEAQADI